MAEKSLKKYKGYKGKTIDEIIALRVEFDRLNAVAHMHKSSEKISMKDICEYFLKISMKFQSVEDRLFRIHF